MARLAESETSRPADVGPLVTLRQRADFLAAARARRSAQPALTLQARPRGDGTDAVRVGFTCSKKVGNAVARNRAKRRLREAARATLTTGGRPGWDYVLIGRPRVTAERPFTALCGDIATALARVHSDKRAKPHAPRAPETRP